MIGESNRPALDLRRRHFVREWKDLCIIGSWIYNPGEEDDEPCIVLMPRFRKSGFIPVCVALSSAYKYDDARYLAHASRQFNRDLGFEDSMANAHKIADAIHGHLRDLLTIPVSPTDRVVTADATVTINGKKSSVEIADYLPMSQV